MLSGNLTAVPLFAAVTSAICARLSKGKGEIHKRVETAGVYPLIAPRGVSARSRALREPATPLESQRQNSRPLGTNTPAAVRVPRSAGAEKAAARRGEHACAVRVPRSAGAEKAAARQGRTRLRSSCTPAQPMQGKLATYLA